MCAAIKRVGRASMIMISHCLPWVRQSFHCTVPINHANDPFVGWYEMHCSAS